MNILKKALLSLACAAALGASMTASAVPVVDHVQENPDQLVLPFFSYNYSHDISSGYTAGSDRLLSALLRIRLTDLIFNEAYVINVGSGQSEFGSNVPNGSYNSPTAGEILSFQLNGASLADLAADGNISISVRSGNLFSSFYFAESTLTAQVPEPLTIALMGIGFLGIGAARRKSAKKTAV